MRTMHLFAGAGGGLLADLILGHEPVCAVEWDAHACGALRERAQDGWLPGLHVHEGDVREVDFRPWARRVDQLAAGFPCQDISAADRGAGLAGSRSGLVSEVFRAIDEIRPPLVFLENSPHIRTKGRRDVIGELVARGYSWRDGKIAASAVGAGHERYRWFLLAANADGLRKLEQERRQQGKRKRAGHGTASAADVVRGECQAGLGQPVEPRTEERDDVAIRAETPGPDIGCHRCHQGKSEQCLRGRFTEAVSVCGPFTDALCPRLEELGRLHADGSRQGTPADSDEAHAAHRLRQRLQVAVQRGGLSPADAAAIEAAARYVAAFDWSPPDAGVCRVVDGLASRVDRIKCAGNGQVPLQAAAAWLMLSR